MSTPRSRATRHLGVVLLGGLALVLAAAVPAGAQDGQRDLQVGDETLFPGQQFAVTGQCPAEAGGQTVSIVLSGAVEGGLLGQIQAGPEGQFEADLVVPEDTPTNTARTIVATCGETGVELTVDVTIVDPEPEPEPDVEVVPTGVVPTGAGGSAGGGGLPVPLIAALFAAGAASVLGGAVVLRRT